MSTHYVSQHREQRPVSHRTHMHHISWGIVCFFLVAAMTGLWIRSGSLESQNAILRSQLAAAITPPTTCQVTGEWRPNTTKKLTINTTNGPRDVSVHVPDNFKGDRYYPLLLFFSGKGSDAIGSEQAFGVDSLPAIVAYPYPSIGNEGVTAWQSAPYAGSDDDVAFTSAILDKLQADMCVDKTRIYATGFSNGGGFASLLSCKLPGRFAAYGIESGAFYYPDGGCTPPQSAPIISIHGDNDDIIPYTGVDWRNLPSVYDWTTMRASYEKCGRPSTLYQNITTVITTWDHCRDGGVVENVRLIGGNHAWGEFPNQMLWQFLSRFTL